MRVLLICDDLWHPADVIERGLASMPPEEMEFDLVKTAKDILSEAFVQRYDVIVVCSGNAINASNSAPWFEPGVTEFGPEEFAEYVRAGGGLVIVHSGLTVHEPVYVDLVGSEFISHPPRCMTHVHITADNEVTYGVQDFSERDEHYELDVTCPDIEPFMETCSETGGTTVSGYIRRFGKGKVVVLAPGHTLAVWENPNYQKLFKNAIRFAAPAAAGK